MSAHNGCSKQTLEFNASISANFFRNLNEIIKILYYANHNNYETQMRVALLLNQQEGSYKKSL